MTEQESTFPTGERETRRGRGPTRPFPVTPLSHAMRLPSSIMEHGVDGRIVRLTLLAKLDQTGEYNLTRDVMTSSFKYGLTIGSYASSTLEITDQGREVLTLGNFSSQAKEKLFEIAIGRIDPFNKVYLKLRGRPLPDADVLKDEFSALGISGTDGQKAADVFVDNIRYLGMVVQIKGRDHVSTIESVLEQLPSVEEVTVDVEDDVPEYDNAEETTVVEPPARETANSTRSVVGVARPSGPSNEPSVHINIQIHIDPSSTPDQVDQIFSSMARHLYGREG